MLAFHNPGEIDIRGATIAGLSAKNSDRPIGFFGTGLKYAIACILRWNGTITIHSGETVHRFTSEAINFRGNAYSQICLDGVPLGFTTEYGKSWEPWQVYRELYSNALDEGGGVSLGAAIPPCDCTTLIEVSCPEVEAIHSERDLIILPADLHYSHRSPSVLVASHPSPSIYYRGVRVRDEKTLLTYNFQSDIELTEDRTMKHNDLDTLIGAVIQAFVDEDLITRVLSASDTFYESKAYFYAHWDTSMEFVAVACRFYKQDAQRWSNLRSIIEKHEPRLLEPTPIDLSPVRQRMLDKAKALVAQMGMPCSFPVIIADLGTSTLGKYSTATGKIYLSPLVFDQGTKQVLSTLYEELVHAHTGRPDCTYSMQTYLFNQIVSLYEEHVFGEPV
jgi:hypothetical protein